MKLLDRFRVARRAFQFSGTWPQITIGDLDRIMDLAYAGEISTSGIEVSEESAQRQATVFACINIKSRDCSSLPIRLVEKLMNGGRAEVTQHPVSEWLKRPNPSMTWKNYRFAAWAQFNVYGNEFAEFKRNVSGAIETWPLAATRVKVEADERGRKRYVLTLQDGTKKTLDAGRVIHNFGYTLNGYWGLSPIRMCMETIGHAQAVERYGSKYFQSPVPRIIFKREGTLRDETALASLKERWNTEFGGVQAQHSAAWLPPGISVDQILKIPNNEAQFIEDKRFSKTEIAQIYNMPPHRLMALERATYNNIEQHAIEYVVYGIMPDLIGYEQTLEAMLLSPQERERFAIKHNVDGLLRGDYKTRIEGNKAAIESGQLTPNEARALDEREAKEGGDELLGPINFAPLMVPRAQQSEPPPVDGNDQE